MSDNDLAPLCTVHIWLPPWREFATAAEAVGFGDDVTFIRKLPDNAGIDGRKVSISFEEKDAQAAWAAGVFDLCLKFASNKQLRAAVMDAIGKVVAKHAKLSAKHSPLPTWPENIYTETAGTVS